MFGVIARAVGGAASKLLRGGVGAGRAVANVPIVKTVAKALPYGATAYAAGDMLFNRGGGLPALPGGMPALPGAGMPSIVGNRGIFQNDPNIVAALQPWAISKTNLRTCYRSPMKGFVIRYDSNGDAFAIPKDLARKYLGWRPSKKPPISVGDWEAVKRADRTVKKVRKVMTTMTRVDKAVGKGGKVKVGKGGAK